MQSASGLQASAAWRSAVRRIHGFASRTYDRLAFIVYCNAAIRKMKRRSTLDGWQRILLQQAQKRFVWPGSAPRILVTEGQFVLIVPHWTTESMCHASSAVGALRQFPVDNASRPLGSMLPNLRIGKL